MLLARDRIERATELLTGSGFHFNEDERVTFSADNVDLAARAAAEVSVKDFVAVPAEEPTRERFPTSAALEVFRPRRF